MGHIVPSGNSGVGVANSKFRVASEGNSMLSVMDLHISINGKKILHGVNLQIPDGEVHALFGPNGSGKSAIMMTIMGYPEYKVRKGRIFFKGHDVTGMPIDERAGLGIGISEQRPPVIKGVKLRDVVKAILSVKKLSDDPTNGMASAIDIDRFLDRDIHDEIGGLGPELEHMISQLTEIGGHA